jgi:rod shape-determining protein MreC
VGRVVKTTSFSSMVLLITDSNNAVTGLIQRTRDEGIVEGTVQGRARMKYIPLLAAVQAGDKVVTSGLTGGFPKGLPIGTISRIDKAEGDLFQSAELVPEVDLRKLEEVLVILDPLPSADTGPRQTGSSAGEPAETKP